MAVRVQAQVMSLSICGGQSSTGADVFTGYIGFPYQSVHLLLGTHYHPSPRAGTVGQTVADLPSGLSLNVTQKTNPHNSYIKNIFKCTYIQFSNVKIGMRQITKRFL
jgi:hypothetical protein